MAEARATLTTTKVWHDTKKVHVIGKLAISASPDTYTTGGIAFNVLTNTVDGAGLGMPLPGMGQQPLWASINGLAYNGQYLPGTQKLKLNTLAGAEVASGAVPAGLSGDTIIFYGIFETMV